MSNGILYLLTVLIWGSTWLAIEFQIGIVPTEVSVFYRYLIAAALLFGWCRWRGLSLSFAAPSHLRFMALGLLMFCLNYIVTYKAQVFITSALGAIIFSTMVWMNMINARLFFRVRSDRQAVLGSLLGVTGIVVIFYPQMGELSWSNTTLYGSLLALFGALLSSLGNMVSQDAQQQRLPILQSNAWGMAYGAVFTGLIAAFSGREFVVEWTAHYVLSLLYLAVFGSIVAFGAYLTLLGRIGAHRAGYAMVLFPVVALTLSVLFEGLALRPSLLAGSALVLAGNACVVRARKRAPQLPDGSGVVETAAVSCCHRARR